MKKRLQVANGKVVTPETPEPFAPIKFCGSCGEPKLRTHRNFKHRAGVGWSKDCRVCMGLAMVDKLASAAK